MAVKLLDLAISTTIQASGLSPPWKVTNAKSHTVQVDFIENNGNITALTVDLEGSIDKVTYHTLASYVFNGDDITSKTAMYHVVNKPVSLVRINVSSITDTGDGTSTISVFYQDFDELLRT